MLIKAYGTQWDVSIFDERKTTRGGKERVIGGMYETRGIEKKVNIWNQRGLYLLYRELEVVYVGKADSTSLGTRLVDHLENEHKGRWDNFSWFGVLEFNEDGRPRRAENRQVRLNNAIETFEALGIICADAVLNKKVESLPGATKIFPANGKVMQNQSQMLREILTIFKKLNETE